MRGTWFFDQSWEPLDEDLSERIELEHVHKFKEYILTKNSGNTTNNNETETTTTTTNNNENSNIDVNEVPVAISAKGQSKQINDRMF